MKINGIPIGDDHPCYIIAEIGINHNGDLDIARKLIDVSFEAGCDAVKFQKRTVEKVYTEDELKTPRDNPFGKTNGDLKRGLEFPFEVYVDLKKYASSKGIDFIMSCWDGDSFRDMVILMDAVKIASACLTYYDLNQEIARSNLPVILSTGMSAMSQIDHALDHFKDCEDRLALLHCTSTYPSIPEELNLKVIPYFKKRFGFPIGYSGHEVGLASTVAAVVMGANVVERHITLDRSMWGSDQAASVEPAGLKRLVRDIRVVETAMGDGVKKVYKSEIPIMNKLRRY